MSLSLRGESSGGLSQPYALANDSEMRLLLGYGGPPRAGRISAVNGGAYTVEIADAENATLTAVALNGFVYAVADVVYVLQAANAPDSGVILGPAGAAQRLGVGVAEADGPLHVGGDAGGFAVLTARAVDSTERTLLDGRVGQVLTGHALAADGATYGTVSASAAVPASSYQAQNLSVGGTTLQFRVYANGDLRVVRTAGTSAPDVAVRALWV